ncbi:ABC transporter permease [Cohnella fermenti]|uniref:Sugar ABC transporter permease n=1 Tax=Cohnella fermenti TaxID=2565925 RepID=A0A4S4BLX5_9BACL|nr:ABC transporter permease subunit [Cohnella fermenti]THF75773.1 sugar ABC transporter permease [Cohnella fermenti]
MTKTEAAHAASLTLKESNPARGKRGRAIWESRYLYVLLLPLMAYMALFQYVPMYGLLLSFKEYNYQSITGSPWTGLDNFRELFGMYEFKRVFSNTLIIAFGRLLFEFPVPILFALLINEVRRKRARTFYQIVYTFPHFLSWVIISGIMLNFLGDMGVFNIILQSLGMEKTNLLTDAGSFKGVLFGTSIWKELGWGTIIYLAAISGINPEMYESAEIDGAGRLRKITAITWPAIKGTVLVLFILALGNVMGGAGFDQIFNMDNAAVRDSSDILDTYIYRATFLQGASFGFTTAVSLFKSVINCLLLLAAHYAVKSRGHGGLF